MILNNTGCMTSGLANDCARLFSIENNQELFNSKQTPPVLSVIPSTVATQKKAQCLEETAKIAEFVWVKIFYYLDDIRVLSGVSRFFRDRLVPIAVDKRIDEFRTLPQANVSLARFQLQLPKKSASYEAQRAFVNKLYFAVSNVKKSRIVSRSLQLSTVHVPFFPIETTDFFDTVYLKIVRECLIGRVTIIDQEDLRQNIEICCQIREKDSSMEIEKILHGVRRAFPYLFFYIDRLAVATTRKQGMPKVAVS